MSIPQRNLIDVFDLLMQLICELRPLISIFLHHQKAYTILLLLSFLDDFEQAQTESKLIQMLIKKEKSKNQK